MAKLIIERELGKAESIEVRCSRCQGIIIKAIEQKFCYCPMCGHEITCIGLVK